MALFISSLNSGSNGNCYYIGNDTEAVLVDAGISCREVERRMDRSGLSMDKVKAILVSHEHSDHITGIPVLAKKYRLPVYITPATLAGSSLKLIPELVHSFSAAEALQFGRLRITAFVKRHDAADPHSFFITDGEVNVGVFTDIGAACDQVTHYFKKCHAAFLESNYCPDMLINGSYPYHLKRRISGGHGHLSNAEALELFSRYRNKKLSHLILSHLSQQNNNPELVAGMFAPAARATKVVVASRYRESEVFTIAAGGGLRKNSRSGQLSLFEER
ncbi:MAG TPA: MBL fold metallo-hydrolase [Chitinophagaceae bacterium]|nr:MBL fold metallo-hydrolase [Chitinophagaceae bacterium]